MKGMSSLNRSIFFRVVELIFLNIDIRCPCMDTILPNKILQCSAVWIFFHYSCFFFFNPGTKERSNK